MLVLHSMETKNDAQLYVAQKAFIIKKDAVLVLFDSVEGLDFPGGKIQSGESDPSLSLTREVFEETSLQVHILNPFHVSMGIFHAEHDLAGKGAYIVCFICSYISGEVCLSEEHENYRWVTKQNISEVDDGSSFFQILTEFVQKYL